MMLIFSTGRFEVPASVRIGTPSPPYATGEVLAIRQMIAARMGGNPSPTSMALQMATGLPAPAAPSRNAPKQKPMRMAWMRASFESDDTDRRMMLNCPVSTVMLYTSIAHRTVQPIGKRPKAAPLRNDLHAMSSGMLNANQARTMAVSAPAAPALDASQPRTTSK